MFTIHKAYSLVFVVFIFLVSVQVTAMNYVQYFNESVLKVEPKEEIKISAALGIGSHLNSISVSDDKKSYSLQTTNHNLYLVGISVNDRTQFLFQIPYTDPSESRAARVDSDVRLYAVSYNWTKAISASISYFRNKGYYLENYNDTHINYVLPGIGIDKYSAMLNYSSNPEHQSTFVDPIIYKQNKDSAAWITSLSFDHTDISQLQDIKVLPSLRKSFLNSANINSLVAQFAYSKNWFWQKWYATAAAGVGLHAHYIKAASDKDQVAETQSPINVLLSLSTGYIWPRFSSGAFYNMSTAQYKFENIDLTTHFGNTGIFVSYQF